MQLISSLPIYWHWNERHVLTINSPSEDCQESFTEFLKEHGPFQTPDQATTIFALMAAIPAGSA